MTSLRRARFAALPLWLASAAALGQLLVPATPRDAFESSRLLAELDASIFDVDSFVDRNGLRQRIAGLRVLDGAVRVSWAPLSHVSVGLEADYRDSRLAPPGLPRAVAAEGLAGAGAYVLWSPSAAAARFPLTLRLAYFGAPDEPDRLLTIRDERSRASLGLELASAPDALPHDFRALFDWGFELGWRGRLRSHPYDTALRLAVGPRVLGSSSLSLHVLALAGIELSGAMPQEGLLFDGEFSSVAFAGPALQLESSRGWAAGLSATWRGIRVRNGLRGFRAAAVLRREI